VANKKTRQAVIDADHFPRHTFTTLVKSDAKADGASPSC